MPHQWQLDDAALLENVDDSATLTSLLHYTGKRKGRYESILPFLQGLTRVQLLSAIFHSEYAPELPASTTNILHKVCFHDHCPPRGCVDEMDVFELGSFIIDTYATDPRHDEYVGMPNGSLYTPLHYAAQSSNMPLVRKLVAHYPKSLFVQNVSGDTPLNCAEQFGSQEVVHYLNWAMGEYDDQQ